MNNFNTVEDILEFAINEENNAVDFYSDLAKKAKTDDMKTIFTDFAKEEMEHKAKLIKIRDEKQFSIAVKDIADLQISDYLVDINATPNMTYEDALVVAMKKEKSAFKLYLNLAQKTTNEELKLVFMSLAQEESKHKLRFEIEYDEYVLKEN